MSTKTIKQRIALVAVSALGFGLMSASAANAVALVANDVNISSTGLTTVCSVAADTQSATAPLSSFGVTLLANAAGVDDNETAIFTISGPAYWSADVDGTGGNVALTSLSIATMSDAGTADDAGATMKFSGT